MHAHTHNPYRCSLVTSTSRLLSLSIIHVVNIMNLDSGPDSDDEETKSVGSTASERVRRMPATTFNTTLSHVPMRVSYADACKIWLDALQKFDRALRKHWIRRCSMLLVNVVDSDLYRCIYWGIENDVGIEFNKAVDCLLTQNYDMKREGSPFPTCITTRFYSCREDCMLAPDYLNTMFGDPDKRFEFRELTPLPSTRAVAECFKTFNFHSRDGGADRRMLDRFFDACVAQDQKWESDAEYNASVPYVFVPGQEGVDEEDDALFDQMVDDSDM